MLMYMCTCIYVPLYIYVHVCVFTHSRVYMCIYAYIFLSLHLFTLLHVYCAQNARFSSVCCVLHLVAVYGNVLQFAAVPGLVQFVSIYFHFLSLSLYTISSCYRALCTTRALCFVSPFVRAILQQAQRAEPYVLPGPFRGRVHTCR